MASLAAQWEVAADEIDNVDRLPHPFPIIRGEGHSQLLLQPIATKDVELELTENFKLTPGLPCAGGDYSAVGRQGQSRTRPIKPRRNTMRGNNLRTP